MLTVSLGKNILTKNLRMIIHPFLVDIFKYCQFVLETTPGFKFFFYKSAFPIHRGLLQSKIVILHLLKLGFESS